MKKFPIGFNAGFVNSSKTEETASSCKHISEPKKSVVQVYFPHRGMSWAYYNDRFDLKVGDYVYVEGKLEGYRGQVIEVNYSFKIKLSDYMRVVEVVDADVKGDFYLAGSHIVSFDRNAIPFSKVLAWFKAPEEEEDIVTGDDETNTFPLSDLSKMKISKEAADRGYDYYFENKVGYIEIDGTCGHAVVEGSENYEIEFSYMDGEISNLKCSCFCSGACKHEFAVMLQLKECLELIEKEYRDEYENYFAIISKGVFVNTVMGKKKSGKIRFGF